MSDGVKGAVSQNLADLGEAVVKPVVDEVGKALEEGVQSVVGTPKSSAPYDPQELQKKQIEEQKRKNWALKVIEWNKNIQEAQAKVRQEQQQKQVQVKREEDEKKKVKQFKVVEKQQKKQDLTQVQLAERKAEIKRGVGG